MRVLLGFVMFRSTAVTLTAPQLMTPNPQSQEPLPRLEGGDVMELTFSHHISNTVAQRGGNIEQRNFHASIHSKHLRDNIGHFQRFFLFSSSS